MRRIVCKANGPNAYTHFNYTPESLECCVEEFNERLKESKENVFFGELMSDGYSDNNRFLIVDETNIAIKFTNLSYEDGCVCADIEFMSTAKGRIARDLIESKDAEFGIRAIAVGTDRTKPRNMQRLITIDVVNS